MKIRTLFASVSLGLLMLLVGCSEGATSSDISDVENSPAVSEPEESNVFFVPEVEYEHILNGTKTSIAGKRGFIYIDKDVALSATSEDLIAFAEEYIEGSDLSWFSIILKNSAGGVAGTGVCFIGSDIYNATYGAIDSDGVVVDPYGSLLYEDGTYEYKAF
ncbi:hypothetical protein RFF05_06545 [Bengtsoniella intestinalis]|uniref:hypothetical protein n=1 Tax=Bengtsoniella intestinalis TaxID=3073143 RepID=UPI00391F8F5E